MNPMWKLDQPLLLASGSATRLNLLKAVGLPVATRSPEIDERAIEADLQARNIEPDAIALELAIAKGLQVSRACPDRLVVAADQTLSFEQEQLHKPKTLDDARAQLRKLSGKTHALHSAVVCFRNGAQIFSHVDSVRLTMRELGKVFLEAYLSAAGDSVTCSVGGYQVEGLGLHLFERIDGDQSTILGLPMLPLLAYLRRAGVLEA